MTPEEFRILLALDAGVLLDPAEVDNGALATLVSKGLATWYDRIAITDEGRKVLAVLEVTP